MNTTRKASYQAALDKYFLFLEGRIDGVKDKVCPVLSGLPHKTPEERCRLLARTMELLPHVDSMTDTELCLGAGILYYFLNVEWK